MGGLSFDYIAGRGCVEQQLKDDWRMLAPDGT